MNEKIDRLIDVIADQQTQIEALKTDVKRKDEYIKNSFEASTNNDKAIDTLCAHVVALSSNRDEKTRDDALEYTLMELDYCRDCRSINCFGDCRNQ